ncbi:hypothetical protein OIU84_012370 [Salix udensis]|uniref:Uncharacterized protein n=1 Tax=Salix udensis TaxID=889485 RepID=A0AAD6NSS8_9ROSI|nr:hypothetical protein OIU84_012370 [Salix udensis]
MNKKWEKKHPKVRVLRKMILVLKSHDEREPQPGPVRNPCNCWKPASPLGWLPGRMMARLASQGGSRYKIWSVLLDVRRFFSAPIRWQCSADILSSGN